MLLDHCYAFGLLLLPSSLKKKFFEEGTPPPPLTYFCLTLDPPLGGYGQNILMHVQNILMHVQSHEHFIPIKFSKHPASGSVVKADYVFPYIHMHYCNPPPLSLPKWIHQKFIKILKAFKSV